MAVKYTVHLPRSEALEMYYELRAKLYGEKHVEPTNHELGEALEAMSDEWAERNRTTCFDNFIVIDDDEYDRWDS